MYKIFIIEDDSGIAQACCRQIESWNMEARCACNLRDPLKEFSDYAPHLVLLDISLPFMDGYHWCAEIRRISKVPIIFISSAGDNMNIIMAMNMGADEFVSKPFEGEVLVAKIRALLRRTYDFTGETQMFYHRGAMLNADEGSLVCQGRTIPLSKNEYRILLLLMKNKGKTVSREKLMEALWQTDEFVDENALTVNVGRLRKKLDNAGLPKFIETKFGMGYFIKGE